MQAQSEHYFFGNISQPLPLCNIAYPFIWFQTLPKNELGEGGAVEELHSRQIPEGSENGLITPTQIAQVLERLCRDFHQGRVPQIEQQFFQQWKNASYKKSEEKVKHPHLVCTDRDTLQRSFANRFTICKIYQRIKCLFILHQNIRFLEHNDSAHNIQRFTSTYKKTYTSILVFRIHYDKPFQLRKWHLFSFQKCKRMVIVHFFKCSKTKILKLYFLLFATLFLFKATESPFFRGNVFLLPIKCVLLFVWY